VKYRITKPAKLHHTVVLPASKSISNRALILHALSDPDGPPPQNISVCDDSFVMKRALEQLRQERLSNGITAGTDNIIDIMAAGTSKRFLTALLTLVPGTHIITGTERMQHRPISILVEALRSLGAHIEYTGQEGFPPLSVTGGQLTGGRLDIEGNVSSQYISALLMIAPVMENGLTLHLTSRLVSRPYVRMTIAMMRQYGAEVKWAGNSTICVAHKPYTPTPYYIEADWSAASYWFEMTALGSGSRQEIILPGLFATSLQGDAAVRQLFQALGVKTRFSKQADGRRELHICRDGRARQRLEYDFSKIPDLAQTAVVTCAVKGIPFRFCGLQTLKIKETDRIEALRTELSKWGIRIEAEGDNVLYWHGPQKQARGASDYLKPSPGAGIDTYQDHRMAMAFAPAALRMGSVIINDPEVVSKSYPGYWDDLRSCGFKVEEIH